MAGTGLWSIFSLPGDSGVVSLLSARVGEGWRRCWCLVEETGNDVRPLKLGKRSGAVGERADDFGPPKAGERTGAVGRRGRRGVDCGRPETVSVTSLRRLLFGSSRRLPASVGGLPGMAGEAGC